MFEAYRHGPSAKSLPQLGNPSGNALGRLLEDAAPNRRTVGGQNAESMFLIAPVDTNKRGTIEFFDSSQILRELGDENNLDTLALAARIPYSETSVVFI